MNQLSAETWHSLPAWALENDALRIVVVPQLGAKIVSIWDKAAAYEWLVGPMRPPRQAEYAAVFVEQDMAGWDEMYPSIDAGSYPLPGPFFGRALPDHGELWAIPWMAEDVSERSLTFSTAGRALPYTFNRQIRLQEPAELVFEYRVTNTGSEAFCGFWTAHPQFRGERGTSIQLPATATEMISVKPDEWWGLPGTRLTWPAAIARGGQTIAYNGAHPGPRPNCHKYYLPPETQVNQARLVTAHGNWLALSWDTAQIPYLGIWIDEQQINSEPVIALEPSSGYYDRLDRAAAAGRCPTLQPGASVSWEITLACGLS